MCGCWNLCPCILCSTRILHIRSYTDKIKQQKDTSSRVHRVPPLNTESSHIRFYLSLHFLTMLSLEISQKWKLSLCPELASCPRHVCGFLNSLLYTDTFGHPKIPKKLFTTPPPGFRRSILCLDHSLLPQVAVNFSFVLQMFLSSTYCFSVLSEFWGRQTGKSTLH